MTNPQQTYDLVLLLDTSVEETLRTKILSETSEAISANGELLRHDAWGERALTYPIDHKTSAEYHLLQFLPSTRQLLSDLNRTLQITDGVVRFRIVKLKPGTPPAPDMSGAQESGGHSEPEPVLSEHA
ncbi:MAG TPA: 30S ribosomal protein S6 [Solirubrobacteraceae bacterium]|jgi:small subunit ribosomal protein S6